MKKANVELVIKNGKIHYKVNGILLKDDMLPEVGMRAVRYVGTDTYAYTIDFVSEDYSWYRMSNGLVAVLVTRSNSRRKGKYVIGREKKGKYVPNKTPYFSCINFDTFWLVRGKAENYFAPSF